MIPGRTYKIKPLKWEHRQDLNGKGAPKVACVRDYQYAVIRDGTLRRGWIATYRHYLAVEWKTIQYGKTAKQCKAQCERHWRMKLEQDLEIVK